MKVTFDKNLKDRNLFVKCTYAEIFSEPVYNRGLKIRSYNSKGFINHKTKDLSGATVEQNIDANNAIIAIATGNIIQDKFGKKWIEAIPNFTNRAEIGYFYDHAVYAGAKQTDNDLNKKEEKKVLPLLLSGLILFEILN